MQQGLIILGALVLGFLFRQGADLVWLVRYVLMWLLFIAFLGMRIDLSVVRRFHLKIVLVNLLMPVLLYLTVGRWYPEVGMALVAFTLAPTAAAAAVFAQFLRIDVAAVTVSTLCTSLIVALALPGFLRWVSPTAGSIPVLDIFLPILSLVGLPLAAAFLLGRIRPALGVRVKRLGRFSIVLFAFNIWVAGGRASQFLFERTDTNWSVVAGIALATGLVSIAQFELGTLLGKPHYPAEANLSMGRKNNMFGLWIALTYLHPLAALGPICNVLWQNGYNSWQLMRKPKAV